MSHHLRASNSVTRKPGARGMSCVRVRGSMLWMLVEYSLREAGMMPGPSWAAAN